MKTGFANHKLHQSVLTPPEMRRYRSRLKPFAGLPPLIALIDILFLTLIFFMVSSSFVQISGIKVDLPRIGATTSAGIEKFIVTIAWAPEGAKIYFNDQEVDEEALKEKLAEVSGISRSAAIVIRADRRVAGEVTLQVISLAARANLASFIEGMPEGARQETYFGPEKQ